LSNLNIHPINASRPAASPEGSSADARVSAPKFSRDKEVRGTDRDDFLGAYGPLSKRYVEEPFPNSPRLIGATLMNGRIPSPSFADDALRHDLRRLCNDVLHGKVEHAARRLEQMSMVRMEDHFDQFHIDRDLFAKLGEVIDNGQLTPTQRVEGMGKVLLETGATSFVASEKARGSRRWAPVAS
jgi:hypothetical protein